MMRHTCMCRFEKIVEKIIKLLFRGNELLFRSNEILFRGNKISLRWNEIFRGNELLFRGNELLFCSNELLFRGNEMLFRGNEILFRGNKILFVGRNYYFVRTSFYFIWKNHYIDGNSRWHQRTSGEILSFRPDSTGLLQKTEVSALSSCNSLLLFGSLDIQQIIVSRERNIISRERNTISRKRNTISRKRKNISREQNIISRERNSKNSHYFFFFLCPFRASVLSGCRRAPRKRWEKLGGGGSKIIFQTWRFRASVHLLIGVWRFANMDVLAWNTPHVFSATGKTAQVSLSILSGLLDISHFRISDRLTPQVSNWHNYFVWQVANKCKCQYCTTNATVHIQLCWNPI